MGIETASENKWLGFTDPSKISLMTRIVTYAWNIYRFFVWFPEILNNLSSVIEITLRTVMQR